MTKAKDAVAHILACSKHGLAIGDALVLRRDMLRFRIHPGFLKDTGGIEGNDGFLLFGVEREILGNIVGKGVVQNLLGIDIKAHPEEFLGNGIGIAGLDEFLVAIEVVEDIADEVFVADFALEGVLEIIGEALLDGIEIIVEALARALHVFADVGNGHS